MADTAFTTLADARYLSLATFRKSGAMVATPVWAAAVDGALWVFSAGDAGKVKRLRNGGRAQLAVCSFNGKLLGPWHAAAAELVTDPIRIDAALAALRRKYGLAMWLADAGARLSGRFTRRAYIAARLIDGETVDA